jgi:predicted transcriptional regulator
MRLKWWRSRSSSAFFFPTWLQLFRSSSHQTAGKLALALPGCKRIITRIQVKEITQEELSRPLVKKQSSIAEMERRSDLIISYLRRYIEALAEG